jgi:hypothetical protein
MTVQQLNTCAPAILNSPMYLLFYKSIVRYADSASSNERNDRESPLLRLPQEIRDQIYGYVFTHDTYIFRSISPRVAGLVQSKATSVGLVSACRRLHHETALLPFTLGSFHCVGISVPEKLYALLTKAQRNSIQRLSFYVNITHKDEVRNFANRMWRRDVVFGQLWPGVREVVVITKGSNTGWTRWGNEMSLRNWLRQGAVSDLKIVFQEG